MLSRSSVLSALASLTTMLTIAGCASFNSIPVSPNDYATQGIRIPERKPIVIVAGGKVSISFVCNNNRQTALQFANYLAKQHIVMNFESCGALNSLDSDTDATAVPVALINTIGEVAKAFSQGVGTSGTLDPSAAMSIFQIFDVRFDEFGDIHLVPLIHKKDLLSVRISSAAENLGANWVPNQAAAPAVAGATPAKATPTPATPAPADGGVADPKKKDVKHIPGFGAGG